MADVTVDIVATIPSSGSAEVQLSEDTTGDGTVDNYESITVQNGTTSAELPSFEGSDGTQVQLDVDLQTTSVTSTPQIHSVTLTAAGVEPIGYAEFDPQSVTQSYRIPIYAEGDVEQSFVWAGPPGLNTDGCAALVSTNDSPIHAVNPVTGERHGVKVEEQ